MSQKDILNMVDEGIITAEDAVKLIAALEEEMVIPMPPVPKPVHSYPGVGKMLKIVVDSKEDGKNSKVRINVPISFIKLAMKTGKGLDINGVNLGDTVDFDVVMKAIEDGMVGEIVNVESDDSFVRIVIE